MSKKELIKKEIERYCEENRLKNYKKSIYALLNKLEEKAPTAITSSQKHELFAAGMIKLYLDNKNIAIQSKALAAFFGLKDPSINDKAATLSAKMKSRQERLRELKEQGFDLGPVVDDFITGRFDFVDKHRYRISDKYYELLDMLDEMDVKTQVKELQKLIKEEPLFLDPYLIIAETYEYEDNQYGRMRYLEMAYDKAVSLIKRKGLYPDELLWGFVENRHIIRAMFNYAMLLWEDGEKDVAINIFVYLLKSNPSDNIGARYSILGILEGYANEVAMEQKFAAKEGYLDALKMDKWFSEKSKKHMKYFKEWYDLIEADDD